MSAVQVHACGASRPRFTAKRGALVIDCHCHLGVPAAARFVADACPGAAPALGFTNPQTEAVNGRMFAATGPALNGVDRRLADMDRLGVDVQVLSPSPGQYYYGAPADIGRHAARLINDALAEAVALHPDRLVGLGTLPMQAPDLAVAELRRCVRELGLRGVELNTNINGAELADPTFAPVLAEAEALGAAVFLHPLGFTHGQRLSEHYLNDIIGNPLESTIALSKLILSGALERHPKLRLCVAHGGGFLPAYWGRMDHAWRAREDCRVHIDRPPSSYLKEVWLDTLVFDSQALDALILAHGSDRLCLGSDYPFDMAEPDPVGFLAGLADRDRAPILASNALDWLYGPQPSEIDTCADPRAQTFLA